MDPSFMRGVEIRAFDISDYEAAYAMWQSMEGMGLSAADAPHAIEAYLRRNPGSSFVALDGSALVGTVLCGHDGRRGLIHHLATAASHRRRGIARALLQHALAALRAQGIEKCHLLVYRSNEPGIAFWRGMGAEVRTNLALLSIATKEG